MKNKKRIFSDKIWKLFQKNRYDKIIKLLKAELKIDPHDHWVLTELGTAYYEKRQYKKALSYAKRALAEASWCPKVLWDYAGTISALGQKKKAIIVWKSLLERGVKKIANGECGEGLALTKMLLNDCRYR